jgi:hypothetical protein
LLLLLHVIPPKVQCVFKECLPETYLLYILTLLAVHLEIADLYPFNLHLSLQIAAGVPNKSYVYQISS